MPNNDTTKIPGPLYAAAGAGDLAIERLRTVPERVAKLQDRLQAELPDRVNELQDKITQRVAELPAFVAELRQRVIDTDTDKLRESAQRNAAAFRSNAQIAQERAAAIYADLVARGEQVVGRTMPPYANDTLIAEVIQAPARASAAVADEVLEGDLTDAPAKPAGKRGAKGSARPGTKARAKPGTKAGAKPGPKKSTGPRKSA